MSAERSHSVLPTLSAVLSTPLPELGALDRMLLRGMTAASLVRIKSVSGVEHIVPDHDPFILALNHNSREEALLVPALLFLLRGGRRIHFLADWNFRLIPGVNVLYVRAGVITVTRKPAKPLILNTMKPFFFVGSPPLEQARQHLIAGRSIGIFPEGTVNRDRLRLLRGRHGAARLSLEMGVPVTPVGIRKGSAIPRGSIEIAVGSPLPVPSAAEGPVTFAKVRARHAQIMSAISLLSGKSWALNTRETTDEAL
ncbi:MAG: 1-acyl-sn-glycerol-3-phosphate acyltransferase [Verrucomicrobia bacterium]|nr:1-acyl-sn-glycerol-3-phosphate acyltransferase [Verrucomicrobiota bacterium]